MLVQQLDLLLVLLQQIFYGKHQIFVPGAASMYTGVSDLVVGSNQTENRVGDASALGTTMAADAPPPTNDNLRSYWQHAKRILADARGEIEASTLETVAEDEKPDFEPDMEEHDDWYDPVLVLMDLIGDGDYPSMLQNHARYENGKNTW